MPTSNATFLELGSTNVRVDSNSPSFLAQVEAIYGSRGHCVDRDHRSIVNVCAQVGQNIASRHRLSIDGTLVCEASTRSELLGRLEWLITAKAVADLGDHLLVHAGAASNGEHAILFPASSGSGKTTLVAALMLNGFDYLSDDVAVVDTDSRLLRPLAKPLCLREGAWYRLKAEHVTLAAVPACRAPGEPVWYLPPVVQHIPCARREIAVIALLHYDPGGTSSLHHVSKGTALAELIQQSFNLAKHRHRAIEVLTELVRGAECCRLVVNDLAQAVKLLRSLVS